jgi:MFS family permease
LTVFIADTTALKSRSLMLAFATTPYIITTWIAGPIAAKILTGPGFRWGFGIFAIAVPVVVGPLISLFFVNQQKAKRLGLIESRRGKLTFAAIKKYIIDVDLFGIIILAAGMALFLLPFSIYSFQEKGWRSPMIIGMLVAGVVLIVAFVIWEKFFAPVTFIPFELLFDRTVFFGGMMFVFLFFNSMVWNAYFFSLLQVVFGQGIRDATYISVSKMLNTQSSSLTFVCRTSTVPAVVSLLSLLVP